MDNKLFIEESSETPKISLDRTTGMFEITGRSLPENSIKFYTPVLQWLEEYVKDPASSTHLTIQLDYFNSASAKKIIEIVIILEKLLSGSHPVNITWRYNQDDELILNRGKEIADLSEIPFEMKAC